MNTKAPELSPEQSAEWEYYLSWYQTHGWVGDEARRLAWQDLCRKYPELGGNPVP